MSTADIRAAAVQRFAANGILLPTFEELKAPHLIDADIRKRLASIDPDEAHPLNLFRMHWFNSADRRDVVDIPGHICLPSSLTGVKAPIYVALGERFPMIGCHKVLAAYACLAPRLVNGQFDPTTHKAVWPSTGNYCRGGVAVSKIMGCRGVAILPEEMSQERFDWLGEWVSDPSDVITTVGGEANVKEIYDKCHEVGAQPETVVFNQFNEFGNALGHYTCTGTALASIIRSAQQSNPELTLFGFTSATGSAGTISAGDFLKEEFRGAKICAVEAMECPTLLENGFGEHNIQGIGDKHVPYIHNLMNTDLVAGVSDAATESLAYVFNNPDGRTYLRERRGVPDEVVSRLGSLGYSSIANILAAIKVAKYYELDHTHAIVTVATDSFDMYTSELPSILTRRFNGRFDQVSAGEAYGQYMLGTSTDHLLEATHADRNRMFNLGYYTWVEQQGVSVAEFESRRRQSFWDGLRPQVAEWDEQIKKFNEEVQA